MVNPFKNKVNSLKNKVILVTGGCGSIGSEIVKQLLKYSPRQIRVLDNRETEEFHMQQEFLEYSNVSFLIGDIRDKDRLKMAMEGVDIVFHAAALKHVPLCEYNPFEAVKTNVNGTQNIIEAALVNNVEKVINISTDKVTNTINTMGATKLLAERLIASAQYYKGKKRTIFSSVRFGNVMGSNGSVIELFKNQISKKRSITLTHPDMTRFIMSISQAVNLVLTTAQKMQGGEIFILKMPIFRLKDLAEVVIEGISPKYNLNPHDIKIKIIGLRPGERMFEDLMTEEESKNAFETKNKLIIFPKIEISCWEKIKKKKCSLSKTTKRGYSSKDILPLSKAKLKELILNEGLFK